MHCHPRQRRTAVLRGAYCSSPAPTPARATPLPLALVLAPRTLLLSRAASSPAPRGARCSSPALVATHCRPALRVARCSSPSLRDRAGRLFLHSSSRTTAAASTDLVLVSRRECKFYGGATHACLRVCLVCQHKRAWILVGRPCVVSSILTQINPNALVGTLSGVLAACVPEGLWRLLQVCDWWPVPPITPTQSHTRARAWRAKRAHTHIHAHARARECEWLTIRDSDRAEEITRE